MLGNLLEGSMLNRPCHGGMNCTIAQLRCMPDSLHDIHLLDASYTQWEPLWQDSTGAQGQGRAQDQQVVRHLAAYLVPRQRARAGAGGAPRISMSYGTLKQASSRPASGGKQATSVRCCGSMSWHTASKYLPCARHQAS